MDIKDILFKKVKCSSFLKKVYDGKFILATHGDIDEATYCDSNTPGIEITSECCGDHDFLKTYYEVKERTFTGFVVGIKDIVVTAWLVADINYDYVGSEHLHIFKDADKIIKCAVVYYQNNKKSYVPLESIKAGD